MQEPEEGRLSWGPVALQQGYARLPVGVMADETLSSGAKLLYAAIASHLWNEAEVAWPSQPRLAAYCSACTRSVRNWTRELEEADLLTVERVENSTIRYRLWVPTPESAAGGEARDSGGAESAAGGGRNLLPVNKKQLKKKQETERETRATPVPPPVENPVENSRLAYVLAQQPPACRTLTEAWLELKSLSGMQAAAEVEALESLRLSVGAAAWEYGMRAALDHDVGRLSYVRKAAEGYRPPPERAAPREKGGGGKAARQPGVLNGRFGKTRTGWDKLYEVET